MDLKKTITNLELQSYTTDKNEIQKKLTYIFKCVNQKPGVSTKILHYLKDGKKTKFRIPTITSTFQTDKPYVNRAQEKRKLKR